MRPRVRCQCSGSILTGSVHAACMARRSRSGCAISAREEVAVVGKRTDAVRALGRAAEVVLLGGDALEPFGCDAQARSLIWSVFCWARGRDAGRPECGAARPRGCCRDLARRWRSGCVRALLRALLGDPPRLQGYCVCHNLANFMRTLTSCIRSAGWRAWAPHLALPRSKRGPPASPRDPREDRDPLPLSRSSGSHGSKRPQARHG